MPNSQNIFSCIRRGTSCILMKWVIFVLDKYADHDFYFITLAHWQNSPQGNSSLCVKFQPTSHSKIYLKYHLIQPTISLEMSVPSQGHYGFHSFPVVYWFCLFIYLWVLTFPFGDHSEFDNFVITLISWNIFYVKACTICHVFFNHEILFSECYGTCSEINQIIALDYLITEYCQ